MKKEITPIQRMLNVWAIILIMWSVYRTYFQGFPVWFDEFVAKPILFIVPLHYYVARYEHVSFLQAIDISFIHKKKDLYIGIGVGVLLLIVSQVLFYVRNGVVTTALFRWSGMGNLVYIVAISIATSISEEILSRGFVLKRLYAESKNLYSSIFIASVLFFLLHIPILFTNPEIRGSLLLQLMATNVLFSVAVSLFYLQRKNLLVAILIHTFYNLSIYLFM